MPTKPNQSYDEQLHNAIKATLNSPMGRLAMAWVMNIVPNDEPHVDGGQVTRDSAHDVNHPMNDREEGFRSAGQKALRYIRIEHPSRYAKLMQEVVFLQVEMDSRLQAELRERDGLDDEDPEGVGIEHE